MIVHLLLLLVRIQFSMKWAFQFNPNGYLKNFRFGPDKTKIIARLHAVRKSEWFDLLKQRKRASETMTKKQQKFEEQKAQHIIVELWLYTIKRFRSILRLLIFFICFLILNEHAFERISLLIGCGGAQDMCRRQTTATTTTWEEKK